MEVTMIIHEIQQLPLSKKFFVMEQTLKSIKNEELKHQAEIAADEPYDAYAGDKELTDFSYLVSEKSLAGDWLSEEDNRWDKLL
jgi:Cdc6-like AAA superfamily ATPase